MSEKKIVIVEFGSWHDECLYTPCLMFTKLGYQVILAANSKLQGRVSRQLAEVTVEQRYFAFGSSLKGLKELWRFRRFLLQSGAEALHINTAQGSLAWKFFLLPLPRRIHVSGIMHNIAKLRGSFGQRFVTRRMDRYVLLSDLLVPAYQATGCRVPFAVSYAIFLPKDNALDASVRKPEGELWAVVPGAVNYHRRDYEALLHLDLPEHVRIILLGNIHKEDGEDFLKRLQAMPEEYQRHFVLFDKFVPNEVFDAYVRECDALLPLVHPGVGELGKYLSDKISGTYNLAVIHRKPMLCPATMRGYGDMQDVALFYGQEESVSLSQLLAQPDLSATIRDALLFQSTKWTEEYQLQQFKAIFQA